MKTTQVSLRLNCGLHAMALLLAAAAKQTLTDVLQSAMREVIEKRFADIPAAAKAHFAEMASEGDVSLEDAKVAMRLASAGLDSQYAPGLLFAYHDDEEPQLVDVVPMYDKPASDTVGKKATGAKRK